MSLKEQIKMTTTTESDEFADLHHEAGLNSVEPKSYQSPVFTKYGDLSANINDLYSGTDDGYGPGYG